MMSKQVNNDFVRHSDAAVVKINGTFLHVSSDLFILPTTSLMSAKILQQI